MKKIRNKIYLNESEFKNIVESAVKDFLIDEMNWRNTASKVGKGIRNAAIGTAAGLGGLYALGQGVDNTIDYQDNLQQQAVEMNGCTRQEAENYLRKRNMPINANNIDAAMRFLNSLNDENDDDSIYFNESRKRSLKTLNEARMHEIIKNNIHKVLGI